MNTVQHGPETSVWPAILGLGVALMALGVVTSLALSALGGLLVVRALVGWVAELCRD